MTSRRPLLVASAALSALLAVAVPAAPAHAATVTVGAGSYTTDLPAGAKGPSDSDGAPVTPKVTAAAAGRPVPTNEWWSSLVFQRYAGNPYSENLYAHPLTFRAVAGGLEVGYPTTPTITATEYHYHHTPDLRLTVAGLHAPRTLVDDWSDWTVTPYWSDGARTLRVTIGHGLPYAYAVPSGGAAQIVFTAAPTVWADRGNVLGVTVNGRHYGIFGPGGTDWSLSGTTLTNPLGGRNYFSVAVLPAPDALDLFARYAFSFVTDTRVSWSYDESTAELTTTYTATTTAKEGSQRGTLLALYRHQWLASTDAMTGYTYVSPRGRMKLREGASFTTRRKFHGVLPALPDLGAYDRARLRDLVRQEAYAADPWQGATDTYWTGKALGRLAQLVPIADQLGDTAARDRLLGLLKGELESWFTAGGEQFRYDPVWTTLTGYPASYGSDTELNDHHFHYGYFLMAAATVARYDAGWAADSRWGGMAKLLAKDADNWDRGDTRFPFLRNFDPYAGHGWASGHQGFAAGNNEESSSEAMNFATGAILLGAATGDTALRDLGVYLYTTQAAAIAQYWFDVDDAVHPAGFGHDTVGMVWGSGAAWATWWTANPEEIHGINMLPITGGSLYHGHYPHDIRQNLREMEAANGGPAVEWRDVIWSFQALADPAAARAGWDAGWSSYTPEEGESKAHTYHWIYNLDRMGTVDPAVTANIPTAAVFVKNGVRTYVAHNFGGAARTVAFSDGRTLQVPARATATATGPGGAAPSPTPTPAPPSPTPSPSAPAAPGGGFDARSIIQAEDFSAHHGAVVEDTGDVGGGKNVGYLADGDWLRFDGVRFGATPARQFLARVASGAGPGISGLVQVRLGSPTAPPVGDFAIANTGGWQSWRTVPANISGVTGTHTVYLTFSSGQPADFVNVNWFTFTD